MDLQHADGGDGIASTEGKLQRLYEKLCVANAAVTGLVSSSRSNLDLSLAHGAVSSIRGCIEYLRDEILDENQYQITSAATGMTADETSG